ncbi:MAG: transporter substrate-binding domain-containing protein, partial [Rhodospirillaceae bacterium]|nr:transporter substrate-binding domain-containing protein [Rhodospirillaceae bacterium]
RLSERHALPAGPYRDAVADNPDYAEVAEQYRQNLALFTGEVEVAVADINIFNWFSHDSRVTSAYDADHAIFPPTPYHVAFISDGARDAFDQALEAMKASGRYDEIIAAYGGVQ